MQVEKDVSLSTRKRNGTEEYFLISLFVAKEDAGQMGMKSALSLLAKLRKLFPWDLGGYRAGGDRDRGVEGRLGGVHLLFHVKLHSQTTVCYPQVISLLVICILRCILNNFAFLLIISMGLLWCGWLCLIAREGQPKVARKSQLLSFTVSSFGLSEY